MLEKELDRQVLFPFNSQQNSFYSHIEYLIDKL